MPADYGEDNVLRDTLLAEINTFREFSALTEKIATKRAQMEQDFYLENKADIERQAELQEEMERLREAFNNYAAAQALAGRKKILGGMVNSRLLKKPGEYDPVALYTWARQFRGLLTLPKEKEEVKKIVKILQDEHPTLLTVDEKQAISTALETYDDGTRVYDDAPVPLVWAVTQTSVEHFRKIMGTLAIEEEFDANHSEPSV